MWMGTQLTGRLCRCGLHVVFAHRWVCFPASCNLANAHALPLEGSYDDEVFIDVFHQDM